jgi:hypothetical protein
MKVTLAIASLAVVVSSCTGAKEAPSSPASPAATGSGAASPSSREVTDYSSFADALKDQGHSVERGNRGGFPGGLMDIPGRGEFIDGEPVLAFEFPSTKAFEEMRSTIRPRGDTIGDAIINWDAPHFYCSGRLIVLYFGDKQRTLDALDTLLGHPFAGGRI